MTRKLDKKLEEWAQRNNLAVQGDAVIAAVNGCSMCFSLGVSQFYASTGTGFFYGGNARNGYVAAMAVEEITWNKQILKALKKELKGVGTPSYAKGVLRVTIRSSLNKEKFFRTLDTAAYILSTTLPQLGGQLAQNCFYCHTPGCDDVVVDEYACHPSHTVCKQNHVQQMLAEVAENERNGNYGLASLLALLGGFVGTLPSIILVVATGWISGWLFALIPLAAGFGYRLAKGVMNRVMLLIVTLTSIVNSILLFFTFMYFFIVLEYGPVGMSDFLILLGYSDPVELIIMLLECVFFCFIGLAISWGYIIKHTNRRKLQQAQVMHGNQYISK